ncbi:CDP-alcohol phosphatidyltransferase family protein [Candidatus Kaiserbacteria bacterium]|nr:CDP-alcohol phosphatidyltransferase family protein [Candidatus Kaiserbacteria bacterium]
MQLWAIELWLWRRCKLPAFQESLANDITIGRGRLSYLGIGLCDIAYAIVDWSSAESGLLAVVATLALMLFSASACLDIVDGHVARRTVETETGKYLDLASDGANVLFSGILLLEMARWPLLELVVPVFGITVCGIITFGYRSSRARNSTTTSARVSQAVVCISMGLFAALLVGKYESAILVGSYMLWTGFVLKVLSTMLYSTAIGNAVEAAFEEWLAIEVAPICRRIARLL